ncbi:MAG: glycosyltransferase family 39 protein [Chloroflexota bacterium]
MPRERIALWTIAVLYLLSAFGFSLVTPVGEPPDEASHVTYIEHLERFYSLPPIEPSSYSYDAFQPPLYYMIGAAIVVGTRAITGSPSRDERLVPVSQGRRMAEVGRDGHFARFRDPELRLRVPWALVLRIPSILMGLGVILLTYATARTIVPLPAPPVVPLIAAAFAALIPEANFIRSSVSNGNLADLLSAWIVLLLVLHLTQPYKRSRIFWLGIALGLGLLTKLSTLLLIVPLLWVLWIKRESLRGLLGDLARVAIPMVLLAAPFYIYRIIAYGDPLALEAMHRMLPSDSHFTLSQLFWFQEPFRMMLWTSFWGVFGHHVLWMPGWIYNVFTAATLLAAVGGVVLLVKRALNRTQQECCAVMLMVLLLMYGLVIQASTYLVAWQGRELFPALSSVCVLFGLGLSGLVLGRSAVQPEPLGKRTYIFATAYVGVLIIALAVLNLYAVVWLVKPGMT